MNQKRATQVNKIRTDNEDDLFYRLATRIMQRLKLKEEQEQSTNKIDILVNKIRANVSNANQNIRIDQRCLITTSQSASGKCYFYETLFAMHRHTYNSITIIENIWYDIELSFLHLKKSYAVEVHIDQTQVTI